VSLGHSLAGLPADFLIGTDGRVLALKYGTDAYDQCSVDELLAIARKHAPAKRGPGLNLGRTQDQERKFTHVRYRFSLEKARRKLLPRVTDRVLNDMLCFRGELTLGVHKIPFLEFSRKCSRRV